MLRSKISVFGILALTLAGLMAGCGGSGDSASSSGTGTMQVYLSDAPVDAKAVYVSISKVEVSKDGSGWITLSSYAPDPLVLNLLDYRYTGSGTIPTRYLLADKPLETGHYTQIRLILTKVTLVDNSNVTYDCSMSSQDKSGLKLTGSFDVSEGTKSAVLIDFDASRSIVQEGNGTYRLKPTVRAVPVQITANVKGNITFKNSEGTTIAVPVGASMAAYNGVEFVASSPITSDGTYYLPAMLAGSYSLVLEFPVDAPLLYVVPLTTVNVTVITATITVDPLIAVPATN
ncbi:MAG: DUF4382 domain-containing protein [Armatimonadota bacterium]